MDFQIWRLRLVFILVILSMGETVFARTFDMKSETVATLMNASYGPSAMSDKAFGEALPSGYTTDLLVPYNLSGEFGIVFTATGINLKLSGEYLFAKTLTGVSGKDSAGVEHFTLNSKASAVVPWAGLEFTLYRSAHTRVTLGGSGGYAVVSLDQDYAVNSAGQAAGYSSFTEKASSTIVGWRSYVGFETLLADNVTMTFDLGYRNLKTGELQSSKATTTLIGSEAQGSTLLNTNGDNRAIDLSGSYAAIGLRIYL